MISIITIVKNDRRIETLLQHVAKLTTKRHHEMIVVDASRGLLDDIRDRHPEVRWIPFVPPEGKHRTYAEQRNCGVHAARGSVIVFIDADCIPEPTWLDKLVQPITHGDESIVSGAVRPVRPNDPMKEEQYGTYRNEAETMNLAVSATVFREVGLFDESLEGCEDSDFCFRAVRHGYRIRHVPAAIVSHDWGGFMQNVRRSFFGGRDRMILYKKHAGHIPVLSPQNLYTAFYMGFLIGLPLILWFPWYVVVLFLPSLVKRRHPVKELYNLTFAAGAIWQIGAFVVAKKRPRTQDTTHKDLVVFVCNGGYHDRTGFGNRVRMISDWLAERYEVVVVCRANNEGGSRIATSLPVKIVPFEANVSITSSANASHMVPGLQETVRTMGLLPSVLRVLIRIWRTHRGRKVYCYTVAAPGVLGLWCGVLSKLFGWKPWVVEFHDLSPELAQSLKDYSAIHPIVRIERLIERINVQIFSRTVVTTQSQHERVIHRCGISQQRMFVIPNLPERVHKTTRSSRRTSSQFLAVHTGSFSHKYSYTGLISFLRACSHRADILDSIHIGIGGNGAGVEHIGREIADSGLQECVTLTTRQEAILQLIVSADCFFIPWEHTPMTETMLPTKFFEYIFSEKPLIAPAFGEFARYLVDRETGLLYNSINEIPECLSFLRDHPRVGQRIAHAAVSHIGTRYTRETVRIHFIDWLNYDL